MHVSTFQTSWWMTSLLKRKCTRTVLCALIEMAVMYTQKSLFKIGALPDRLTYFWQWTRGIFLCVSVSQTSFTAIHLAEPWNWCPFNHKTQITLSLIYLLILETFMQINILWIKYQFSQIMKKTYLTYLAGDSLYRFFAEIFVTVQNTMEVNKHLWCSKYHKTGFEMSNAACLFKVIRIFPGWLFRIIHWHHCELLELYGSC